MTKREKQRLLDQLRGALQASTLSRYEVAKRSGVDEAALSRFVRGGSLTVDSIERLAPTLGLELVLKASDVDRTRKKKKAAGDDSDLQGLRRPTPKGRPRNARKRG